MRVSSLFLNEKVISMLLLSVSIALAGYLTSDSISKFHLSERQVSVKGLAEKEVISDFATWTIILKVTANDLSECSNKIETDKAQIVDFLIKQGFDSNEITIGNYTVNDLLTQTYRQNNSEEFRYVINSAVILRTEKVELVQKATQSQNLLTQKNVVFENEGPYFEFTKFTDLKPEMLAESIKNARIAAEKFAVDSGAKIGQLKKANQGIFIIGPVGSVESENIYENAQIAKKSLHKKIRVVSTLEYFLENN